MSPDEDAGATPVDEGSDATSAPTDEGAKFQEAMKAAGLDDPTKALETIAKLRQYERGEQLPRKVDTELKALRGKVKEFEDAQKSEGEKAAERIAELERDSASKDERIQALTIRGAFSKTAREAGALYPDDAYKLADLSKVEYNEDGEPTNLDAIVEDLKANRPAMFGQERPPSFEGGRRGDSTPSGPTMDDRLRAAVRGGN